jgi:hypothetical protein
MGSVTDSDRLAYFAKPYTVMQGREHGRLEVHLKPIFLNFLRAWLNVTHVFALLSRIPVFLKPPARQPEWP